MARKRTIKPRLVDAMVRKFILNFSVASFGGGLNSTAMLILLRKMGISLDLILFADTGAERPETYCHIKMMDTWLLKNNYPKIITVIKTDIKGKPLSLEQNCLEHAMLPSLAYGFKKCSLKFKINPQDKFLNNFPLTKKIWENGNKVLKFIGYDADEDHRIKDYKSDKYEYKYPLIDAGIGREACKIIVKKEGLPLPVKSSCFFCPAMKKMEIRELKQKHPKLIKRALKLEKKALANLKTVEGLGRYFAWAKFLENGELFPELFPDNDIELVCGCYDG